MNKNDNKNKCIVIIPARGGSKGIPRKNLRPIAGLPLIYYSITASLKAKFISRVVISTDDEEIALFAERFGAEVIMRQKSLADDKTPLDPVIFNVLAEIENKHDEHFDTIVTVQPTSPLIQSYDIDNVIDKLLVGSFDTVLTVVDDRHLCWTIKNNKAVSLYEQRVNRQLLPANFKETGSVIACTNKQLKTGTRIGKNVGLVEIPQNRSFDIDNFSDLYLCESILNRKKIVFTVIGYADVGLGHAYRAVMLAHEFVNYELLFICERKNNLAIKYIESNHYTVIVCDDGDLVGTIIDYSPHIVINDILDTDKKYIEALKKHGIKVVNFEDLGEGHLYADLVINALYLESHSSKHILTGEKYFCVRDEFLYIEKISKSGTVKEVLLTFGGVDEGNLTTKVLSSIAELCTERNITVIIVLGPGFRNRKSLNLFLQKVSHLTVRIHDKTKRISHFMNSADVAITSGGRTVLELATLKVPTIVICQNERETTHTFASEKNGVINLGHRKKLSKNTMLLAFNQVISNNSLRCEMSNKMSSLDLTLGKQRVINKIKSIIK